MAHNPSCGELYPPGHDGGMTSASTCANSDHHGRPEAYHSSSLQFELRVEDDDGQHVNDHDWVTKTPSPRGTPSHSPELGYASISVPSLPLSAMPRPDSPHLTNVFPRQQSPPPSQSHSPHQPSSPQLPAAAVMQGAIAMPVVFVPCASPCQSPPQSPKHVQQMEQQMSPHASPKHMSPNTGPQAMCHVSSQGCWPREQMPQQQQAYQQVPVMTSPVPVVWDPRLQQMTWSPLPSPMQSQAPSPQASAPSSPRENSLVGCGPFPFTNMDVNQLPVVSQPGMNSIDNQSSCMNNFGCPRGMHPNHQLNRSSPSGTHWGNDGTRGSPSGETFRGSPARENQAPSPYPDANPQLSQQRQQQMWSRPNSPTQRAENNHPEITSQQHQMQEQMRQHHIHQQQMQEQYQQLQRQQQMHNHMQEQKMQQQMQQQQMTHQSQQHGWDVCNRALSTRSAEDSRVPSPDGPRMHSSNSISHQAHPHQAVIPKQIVSHGSLANTFDLEQGLHMPMVPQQAHSIWHIVGTACGAQRILWTVDAGKLRSVERQAVSPSFDLPLSTNATSRLVIVPRPNADGKGSASFKKSGGCGSVQLKCEASDGNVKFVLSITDGTADYPKKQRGPVEHDFAEHSTCGLPKEQEQWDFRNAVNPITQTFAVCLDILPLTF